MRLSLSKHIDMLQSRGTYYFEKAKVQSELGLSDYAMSSALRRLVHKKRIARPKSNFYVIVPIEYQDSGCPPTSWFIDALMKFLGREYYVGVLSAAAHHGAAHQRPYEFQIVTNIQLRTIHVGHHRIRFFTKKNINNVETQSINTYTGTMKISTPEETAFDLIRYTAGAGYLNNVATVLIELAEEIDAEKLLVAAQLGNEKACIQRLGYLIDTYCEEQVTGPLFKWFNQQDVLSVPLRPDKPIKGAPIDRKWNIYINEEVEPDL